MTEIRFPIWVGGDLEHEIVDWIKEHGLVFSQFDLIEIPDGMDGLAIMFALKFGTFPLEDPRKWS